MSETTNYKLHLTDDESEPFLDWRKAINGTENSNMVKIDAALGGKQDKLTGAPGTVLGFDENGELETQSVVGAYEAAVEAGYTGTEEQFSNDFGRLLGLPSQYYPESAGGALTEGLPTLYPFGINNAPGLQWQMMYRIAGGFYGLQFKEAAGYHRALIGGIDTPKDIYDAANKMYVDETVERKAIIAFPAESIVPLTVDGVPCWELSMAAQKSGSEIGITISGDYIQLSSTGLVEVRVPAGFCLAEGGSHHTIILTDKNGNSCSGTLGGRQRNYHIQNY